MNEILFYLSVLLLHRYGMAKIIENYCPKILVAMEENF